MAQQNGVITISQDDIHVSRPMPVALTRAMNWIEWMQFCDKIDAALQPLQSLDTKKLNTPLRFHQNSVKAKALEDIQAACDKQSKKTPSVAFLLYCPFHTTDTSCGNSLIENWHIQVSVSDDGSSISEAAAAPAVASSSLDSAPPETSDDHDDGDDEAHHHRSSSHQDVIHGILGQDYTEHQVLPTDTLQGICLHYKISAKCLKRANGLLGDNSLRLAPERLVIPISDQGKDKGYYVSLDNTDSNDYKMRALRTKFPKLKASEAKAYLELADWNLEDALASVREDFNWEERSEDFEWLARDQPTALSSNEGNNHLDEESAPHNERVHNLELEA